MFGFIKKNVYGGNCIYWIKLVCPLKCVSMSNGECKVRHVI